MSRTRLCQVGNPKRVGRRLRPRGLQLQFGEDLFRNGLGDAVHFVDAPGDADDGLDGALVCRHFGEVQVGIDLPLRVR